MRVQVLGPVLVEDDDGTVVAPRGVRQRELLAALCTRHGRPMAAEMLLDLIWGGRDRELTPAIVHTAVARLRRQFGAGLIDTSALGYLVPAGIEVDADRFTELATRAHEPHLAPDDPERLCREALGLWRGGDAYAGVTCDVLRPERVRLQELRHLIQLDLARHLLTAGPAATRPRTARASEALRLAQGLIADNPTDEGAVLIAMRAAYLLRRQGEAFQHFDRLRHVLRDELGIVPAPAVRELYARILSQDPGLDGRPPRPSPGRQPRAPLNPTIGRGDEQAAVLEAVAHGRRLITICGPGGVGKSRLLADVGNALASSSNVVPISLSGKPAQSTEDLAVDLAVTAGVPLDGADVVGSLVRLLQAGDILFLVDEAEWVVESVARLAVAILAGAPRVRLVVTSRVPLQVAGEHVVELHPLAVADPAGPVGALVAASAVHLLVERLHDRGVLPSADPVRLSETELRAVAEVADRLDGLPLALELVAGAAGSTSIARLPDLVAHPLELTTVDHGRDERQQSLRRTIAWSVERLAPLSRVVLGEMSVFAGSFAPAAARAVSSLEPDAVDRALRELAAQHLLTVERGSDALGFRLLRTVREFAQEELVAAGGRQAARARHRAWFAGRWRDVPLCDALIEDVGRSEDDHLAALIGALEAGDDVAAADLVTVLGRRWLFVEASAPGLHWTGQLLARTGLTPHQRARLRVLQGGFDPQMMASTAEYAELTEALIDDPDWTCWLEQLFTVTAYLGGDLAAAHQHLNRARAVAERAAPHHLPELVATRAVLSSAAGDTESAVLLAHEALARIGEPASTVHHVTVMPKIALALIDAGRPREALGLLEASVREAAAHFGIGPTATTSINAGWAALASDQPAVAIDWFAHAILDAYAAAAPAILGECAEGLGAALLASSPTAAAELLGLGRRLLDIDGSVLSPSLASLVAAAREISPSVPSPAGWTPDLINARIVQVTRAVTRPGTDASAR